jgi:predicted nuclease of predicted toxin-antitoxin system
MNIKLDENLPVQLAILLKNIGHDVHTAHEEQLVGHADSEIWAAAQSESRFLITQDMDFSDTRRFTPGTHHGLLLVRLRSPNRRNLSERIQELFRSEDVVHWVGCFVVATERKIRVLKPKGRQTS